jgi:hypothetical protein
VVVVVLSLAGEIGLVAAGGAAKDEAVKKDLLALKGTWAVVLAEMDGKDVTDKSITLFYDGAGMIRLYPISRAIFATRP